MTSKTVELVRQSTGKRIVRLFAPYERYFVASAKDHSGKQFRVQHILTHSDHGQNFLDLGIQSGWILTKIGYDEDTTNLRYCIVKNKLSLLAKQAKRNGYVLTFEGAEASKSTQNQPHQMSNSSNMYTGMTPIISKCDPLQIQ